jgi:hypothetical protein
MVNRRRRIRKGDDIDESVGLSGWLYTDLMLGLAVVFLGAAVIKLPDLMTNEEGETVVASTTTTTIPIKLCTSLFAPDDQRNDDLLVKVRTSSEGQQLIDEFKYGLIVLYDNLNSRPDVQESGFVFDVETTKIGLVLARAGSNQSGNDTSSNARETRNKLGQLLPDIMGSAPGRDSYTTRIDESLVGMEILPLIELPCGTS